MVEGEEDGVPHDARDVGLGTWTLPGGAGPGVLVVSRAGDWITAKLDERFVTSVPLPTPSHLAVSSGRVVFSGREYALYAEVLGSGGDVKCDVFVDGRSLSTGESFADIEQRREQLNSFAPVVTSDPPTLRRVSDPELGECSRAGGSRSYLLGMVGHVALTLGLIALAVVSRNTSARPLTVGFASIAVVLAVTEALATGRTELLIGQMGFRYRRGIRRVQANWQDTGPARQDGVGDKKVVALPRRDANGTWSVTRIPNALEIPLEDVCGLLNLARFDRVGVDIDRDERIEMAAKATGPKRILDWFVHRWIR
jgi:hypothetical protein